MSAGIAVSFLHLCLPMNAQASAPEILSVRIPEAQNCIGGNVYYYNNTDQSVVIEISGGDLTAERTWVEYVTESAGGIPEEHRESLAGIEPENGICTYSLELDTADTVYRDLRIHAEDIAGNTSEDDSYAGAVFITDISGPRITLSADGDIEGYFVNNGNVYARFAEKAAGPSGELSGAEDETVTLRVEIKDYNLTADPQPDQMDLYCISDHLQDGLFRREEGAEDGSPAVIYEKTISAQADETAVLDFDLTIQDLAGNTADTFMIDDSRNLAETAHEYFQYDRQSGRLTGKLICDRRRPSDTMYGTDEKAAPVISLQRNTEPAAFLEAGSGREEDAVELYTGPAEYSVTVFDPAEVTGGEELYSGLGSVTWSVQAFDTAGNEMDSFVSTNELSFEKGIRSTGTFCIEVNIDPDDHRESGQVVLIVTAEDTAGNTTVREHILAIDNRAPSVSAAFQEDPVYTDENNIDYYNNDLTVTFTASDISIARTAVEWEYYDIANDLPGDPVRKMTVESEDTETGDEGMRRQSVSLTLSDGQMLCGYHVTAYDAAGRILAEEGKDCGNHFAERSSDSSTFHKAVADSTDPTLEIVQSCRDAAGSFGGYDYFNVPVRFDITVFDLDIQEKDIVVTLSGEHRGDIRVELKAAGTDGPDRFTYKGFFVLDNTEPDPALPGDILERFTAVIRDKAQNTVDISADLVNDTGMRLVRENGAVKTAADSPGFIIDRASPGPVRIIAPEERADNRNGSTYYYGMNNTDLMIEVSAADVNLNPEKTAVHYFTEINGITEEHTVSFEGAEKNGAEYTLFLPMEENTLYRGIEVSAEDHSQNKSTNTKIREECFILDSAAPQIDVSVTGPGIESFFVNPDNRGQVYVSFNRKASADSAQLSDAEPEEITLTAVVEDRNITKDPDAGYEKEYYVTDNSNGGFFRGGAVHRNQDTVLVYTKKLSAAGDSSGTLVFDLTVCDLAGNRAVDYSISGSGGLDALKPYFARIADGRIRGKVTADRIRPSGSSKYHPPVIALSESGSAGTVINPQGEAVKLYAGSMSYTLRVTDPSEYDEDLREQYSGLASVSWTVESDSGLVSTSGNDHDHLNGIQSAEFEIPVLFNGIGETNDIAVTVTAEDQAGNRTFYRQMLAIDNRPPDVTVSYSNNAAANGKYFKNDRELTVRVEDLNFDPAETHITTQAGFSGWSRSGNVYTGTIVYNTDGDYTFDMDSADMAGNRAVIDFTDNGANIVPQAFTIDKTAPVITVTFNKQRYKNTRYFNRAGIGNSDLAAAVAITEYNFSETGAEISVSASLNGTPFKAPLMGHFDVSGDIHTAQIVFSRDGDYRITVNYTDLAGNRAETVLIPEFTVDTEPPRAVLTGVEDHHAYTGSIRPVLTVTDNNYDPGNCRIIRSAVHIGGTERFEEDQAACELLPGGKGAVYTMDDLPMLAGNDGIYKITAAAADLAGNSCYTGTVTYSVNRFGSVYSVNDQATKKLLDAGVVSRAPALSVMETNPDYLTAFFVTVSVNGTERTLVEGKDFTVAKHEIRDAWKQYAYYIPEKVFLDENGRLVQGEYMIAIESDDDAGNRNSSRSNAEPNRLALKFTIDSEPASGYIDVTGLREGRDSITAAETDVTVYWEDNIGVAKTAVYLNGELYKHLEGDELASCGGSWAFTVNESDDEQSVYAVLTDMAGNETLVPKVSFYLNAGVFRQFLHNRPLFFTVTAAAAGAAALAAVLIVRKRKRLRN